ncbi:MAG: zinc-binding alcohol dehydrogenase family protein [Terracidiphilus sp.]
MKAAVVNVLGQPPRYQDFEEPKAGDGEVLIDVRAAGLHPIVKALASGSHYAGKGEVPAVPGLDGVGTLKNGSRVYFTFARKPWGSMCERTVASRAKCLPLPDNIDDIQAAAIVNPGMSAWLSISERARLVKGESVLILGATGVAGQLAIQVARHLGARRIVAAGRNLEALASENLDGVVSLTQGDDAIREAFSVEAGKGIDVVIDYLWGRPTELLLEALAKRFDPNAAQATRLVELGESAGKTITLPGATLRSIDLKLMGGGFGSVPLERVFSAIPTLFELAATGSLKVTTEPVPLAEVETAWSRKESGRRIVFTT